MKNIFDFLDCLSKENLDFSLVYKDGKIIQVSIDAGSEFWKVDFGALGFEFIRIYSPRGNVIDQSIDSLELLFHRVQRAWSNCADDLKVEIICNYVFHGIDGQRFEAPVYLPEFGSTRGTLLFLPNSKGSNVDAAIDCGFYVSFIDPSQFDHYNKELFKNTLIDFRWKSDKKPPEWYM